MNNCPECTRLRGESTAAFAEYTARKDELAMTGKRDKSFAARRQAFEQAKGRLRECHKQEANHRVDAHSGRKSQRADQGLEAGSDFGWRRVGREGDWGADVDGDFAGMGEAAVLLLHEPEAVDAHGDYGNVEILRQQADAGLERRHFRSFAHVDIALGKNQDTVAAIDRFPGKTKAFAKTGKSRKRENVEERHYREIFEPAQETFCERPFAWRVAE